MNRKYTINSCLDFQTGRLPDGRQALIGLLCPAAWAILFSADGDYQETVERNLEFLKPRHDGTFDIYDDRIDPKADTS